MTYSDYLKLDQLLAVQSPKSKGPEHDEMLFIIIHQVYELWFKEILHELDYLQTLIEDGKVGSSSHTFTRILKILKVAVAQIDILETMTPLEYLTFRDQLGAASGFESFQFRELEFVLGLKNPDIINEFPENSPEYHRLVDRYEHHTLWDSLMRFLKREGFDVPRDVLERDIRKPVSESPSARNVLLEVYRNNKRVASLLELFVDLDEGLLEWRYRYLRMLQRTIGQKTKVAGPEKYYSSKAIEDPIYPDLWNIRAEF